MRFRDDRIAAEWSSQLISPLLKGIVQDASEYALAKHDWLFLLTCIHRTPSENDALYGGKGDHLSGVHVDWRGIDVRTRDQDPSAVQDVTTFVNDRWEYDPTRPAMRVALPEGAGIGSSAQHLHFQVHPRTAQRPHSEAVQIASSVRSVAPGGANGRNST